MASRMKSGGWIDLENNDAGVPLRPGVYAVVIKRGVKMTRTDEIWLHLRPDGWFRLNGEPYDGDRFEKKLRCKRIGDLSILAPTR